MLSGDSVKLTIAVEYVLSTIQHFLFRGFLIYEIFLWQGSPLGGRFDVFSISQLELGPEIKLYYYTISKKLLSQS